MRSDAKGGLIASAEGVPCSPLASQVPTAGAIDVGAAAAAAGAVSTAVSTAAVTAPSTHKVILSPRCASRALVASCTNWG